MDIDVTVQDHGTIWTFAVESPAAQVWVAENVDLPDYMGTPVAFSADWRMGRDLVEGMRAEGFVVEASE